VEEVDPSLLLESAEVTFCKASSKRKHHEYAF